MPEPVDLLLISWNRREYLEKTLDNLLSSPEDFNLYCWDNGSTDGATDIIASCRDERIVEKHFCPINIMQAYPTQWFLDRSQFSVIGKVDDDTLVPQRWIDTIATAVRNHKELGMIGCWTFWPDDFHRNSEKAHKKVIQVGSHRILQNILIGGTAFLMRREVAFRYLISNHNGRAFPIDRILMTEDGFISGWYYPLIQTEHMDDPRSKHCLMNKPQGMLQHAALTARTRQIKSAEQYQKWIMADADSLLSNTVKQQIRKKRRGKTFAYKLFSKIKQGLLETDSRDL